jgi:hypothetical protein
MADLPPPPKPEPKFAEVDKAHEANIRDRINFIRVSFSKARSSASQPDAGPKEMQTHGFSQFLQFGQFNQNFSQFLQFDQFNQNFNQFLNFNDFTDFSNS